jgi:hypothetical protein
MIKLPKGTSLRETTSFEPLCVFLLRPVRAVHASEKLQITNIKIKKAREGNISRICRGATKLAYSEISAI